MTQIRKLRLQRGLTQQAFAKLLGYSGNGAESYISRIESGDHCPRISTLQKFATALGVTLDVLILEEDEQ